MKNASDSARHAREAVVTDLGVIVGDADKLLKDMASLTTEEFAAARSSIEATSASQNTEAVESAFG